MEQIKSILNIIVKESMTPQDEILMDSIRDMDISEDSKTRKIQSEIFDKKYYDFDKKLRVDALKEVLHRRYVNYFNNLIDSENVEELLPTLKLIKEQEDANENVKHSRYCFITLAPASCVGVFDLLKLIKRVVEFNWVLKYVYVIEQRHDGTTEGKNSKLGDGMHAHLFIDKGNYTHMKRDVTRVFKNMNINIDYSFRHERDVHKTTEYMLGVKKDEHKQIKQNYDKEYRSLLGIPDFFGERFDI